MSRQPKSILKQPTRKAAEDYYRLRSEGIGFIEQMGSRHWTDYNTHDPGITLLEALSYAITDLAYRTGWDIKDILAPPPGLNDPDDPALAQAFFTARDILTLTPWTPDDFRQLLIDIDRVRNAWVFCKDCACDLHYYAWCEDEELKLAYRPNTRDKSIVAAKVAPRGLYEVLLELENDVESGDLNDRKIEYPATFTDVSGSTHALTLELRFPDWSLTEEQELQLFESSTDAFEMLNGGSFSIGLTLGATKDYDVLTDATLSVEAKNAYLRRHWGDLFYVSFELTLQPGGEVIHIANATLRFLGNPAARGAITITNVINWLSDESSQGVIRRYRTKLLRIREAVRAAVQRLHAHRNLAEDYCRVRGVDVQEVAVCADVELEPDADVEKVQARIWFLIEQYFNPPVPFYTLKEMMNDGIPVEEIFNGPALDNGFIKQPELQAAQLKTILRTSDIINLLMDIEGVRAVNNLLLTKYDSEGRVVKGAADPEWNNGMPVFDPDKTSASWLLYMDELHQPRLYYNLSRFLFYKNGLPFLPRLGEVRDLLLQMKGEAERPKIKTADRDLPVPAGSFRNLQSYFPAQYSLPLTYGTGPEGLPSHVSARRRAQAKQLKAYLLVFEQILANAHAQVAHLPLLFSLSSGVKKTHYARLLTEADIQGYTELAGGLTDAELNSLTETETEFLQRRNRFLDHLAARFGENFGAYSLLLNNLYGAQKGQAKLIEDKLSFLRVYPVVSRNRARAFNYKTELCDPENIPGIKKRVSLLLGFPDLYFEWTFTNDDITAFELKDRSGTVWLQGDPQVSNPDHAAAACEALKKVTGRTALHHAYSIVPEGSGLRLRVLNPDSSILGQHPQLFGAMPDAVELSNELIAWTANERMIVVEHLLLRPKFPGDALYPACSEGGCHTCGDEDPYSFRLTFVMAGWTAPFNTNLDMRRFADQTIRQETPSHLLPKICWVGNDGFTADLCDPIVAKLADLLEQKGATQNGQRPSPEEACECANALYLAFSQEFIDWYADKTLDYIHPDHLETLLRTLFNHPDLQDTSCAVDLTGIWHEVRDLLTAHFLHTALYGWQFERFEKAWLQWVETNAAFDWTEERLQERVEAFLWEHVMPARLPARSLRTQLCHCAANILAIHGESFRLWLADNVEAGHTLDELTAFVAPPVTLCPGLNFQPGTAQKLAAWLQERYDGYVEVSYRLYTLLQLLANLRNIWPGATLHDCDDGSDQNPVRLGATALGNYRLQRTPANPQAPAMRTQAEAFETHALFAEHVEPEQEDLFKTTEAAALDPEPDATASEPKEKKPGRPAPKPQGPKKGAAKTTKKPPKK